MTSTELVNKIVGIVVILPVYKQVEMTERAILSAMPEILISDNIHLLAINDASPDERMQSMLEKCAQHWPAHFTVLQNKHNLGFVGTVNRGLSYFPKYDAVLLNTDVIVANNWLTRLKNEAYTANDIGTVTPFSNNATICSFPNFLEKNNLIFKRQVDEMDAVFKSTYLPCVEAPTGIGFCMYIRRACLDEIGILNAEKFGRGYGEENDLCQRGLKKGWRNLISPNIYAYHEGEVSFGDDKAALVERAMQVINELHPNYHADVQRFIQKDELKYARLTRYAQILTSLDLPKVLHISHGLGGGIEQYIDELGHYQQDAVVHFLLEPQQNVTDGLCLKFSLDKKSDVIFLNLQTDYKAIIELLKSLGLNCLHFHQIVGYSGEILKLAYDLDVPYLISVHDFYWLAGNPTLTDEQGKYPGYYSESLINPLYPLPNGMSLENFQKPLVKFVENAEHIIFPSQQTMTIFAGVYHFSCFSIAHHLDIGRDLHKEIARLKDKPRYTIGVLGALSREKGADLLEKLAVLAKSQALPYQFTLLGYAYRSLTEVNITGAYQADNLPELIKEQQIDIIFFPAQWPETYSYTLSYALDSGLPIIAPELGVFPERLSGRENSLLFKYPVDTELLSQQLTCFIHRLQQGETITAPSFTSKNEIDFYSKRYIQLISQYPEKGTASQKQNKALFKAEWLTQLSYTTDLNHREIILAYLWRIYTNDALQGVVRLIPFRLSRFIKRSLSRRPLFEIIKK